VLLLMSSRMFLPHEEPSILLLAPSPALLLREKPSKPPLVRAASSRGDVGVIPHTVARASS
jgi:hypothetical protein